MIKRIGKSIDPDDSRYWLIEYLLSDGGIKYVRKLRHSKEGYGHPGLNVPNSEESLTFTPNAK